MGGGSSSQIKQDPNQELNNNQQKQNLAKSRAKNTNSKNNSPIASPRTNKNLNDKLNQDREKVDKMNKSKVNSQQQSPLNSGRKQNNEPINMDHIIQNIVQSKREKIGNMFIEPYGQYPLDIQLMNIRQRKTQKKLEMKNAKYEASLIWKLDVKKQKWIFQLRQKDNYISKFMVNINGDLQEGNAAVWAVVSPICNNKNRTKVGNFNCESYYQKLDSNQNDNQISMRSIDEFDKNEVFQKWGQKHIKRPIDFPSFSRKHKSTKNLKSKTNNSESFIQMSRYFMGATTWECSYYVQEKNNELTIWIISKTNSDQNQRLVQKLQKDLTDRKNSYVENMRDLLGVF